jgi:PAS domain S-box-containing protein
MIEEVLASEVWFDFLNALPSSAALLDSTGKIIAVNSVWRELGHASALNVPNSGIGLNYLDICQQTPPELAEAAATAAAIRQILSQERAEFTLDYFCPSPDRPRWFTLRISPLVVGSETWAVICHHDITENKLAKLRLDRLGRLYSVLSQVSQAIVSTEQPAALYDATCRIIVEQGMLKTALIAEAKSGSVSVVSAYGERGEYIPQLLVTTDGSLTGAGTIEVALRTGAHDLCNDFANDPRMASWREAASAYGYGATASFPLKTSEGKTFGCLTLFAAESDYFQDDEITLMLAVAGDLSFAVESRLKEEEGGQAQLALLASEATMAAAQRVAHFGSWQLDMVSENDIFANALSWSDEMYRIAGFEPKSVDVTTSMFFNLVPPKEQEPIRRAVEAAIRERGTLSIVHRLVRPDGEERIVQETGQVFIDQKSGTLLKLVGTAHDITEQRLAEQNERVAKERFDILAKATKDAIWDWDLCTNSLWFNEGFETLFLFRRDELEPTIEAWSNRIHPDDKQSIIDSIHLAIERGDESWSREYRFQRKDGGYLPVLDRGYIVRDVSGKAIRMVGGITDLAGRIRSERALRESEQRFRGIAAQLEKVLDFSLDVICSIDSEGRFVQINSACENVWGYTVEELLGTRYMEKVIAEDHQITALVAEKIMAGQPTRRFENRYRKKSGEITYMQWAAHWSETEQIMFCVARDISEFKRNTERITEQASLLDKAQDAILVRDLEHQIRYWNQSAERLYGWSAEEVVGRSILPLLYGDSTSYFNAHDKLLAEGEWVGELEQITKDGRAITVEARLTLVRDEVGNAKAVLSINTDITTRKQLELQFLRAQRMESLGTLAGGIAHDLNNVLSPILMAIDLLKLDETDPERMDTLDVMESSAKRGAEMVRQVLSFARGMHGRQVDVDARSVIKDVFKIAQEAFPKNFEFVNKTADDLWILQADPTQLHQVLLNLCVNARDAMPSGGQISIFAENTFIDEYYAAMTIDAKVGPYVKIVVEDCGSGIGKDIIDKIFDPFFTTKEVGRGTGLGLSTTLAIVKSHGGFLHVESQVGVGTKFSIYFPAQPEKIDRIEVAPLTELPRGRGQTVLVVDDEQAIREISRQTLEAFGYRVLLAGDGPEAVSLYVENQHEIAVVVTDMMMPLMDGPTTIRVLKRLNPTVRIIGVSGITTIAMASEASAAGVDHFLDKPYTADALLQLLKRVLSERPTPSP